MPAYRDSTSATTPNSTSIPVTVPSTVVAGDTLVVHITASGAVNVTTPAAGWTYLTDYYNVNSTGAASRARGYIYTRVAQAGDASSTFTFILSTSPDGAWQMLAYSSAGTVTTQNTNLPGGNATNPTVTAPSVTANSGDIVLSLFQVNVNTGFGVFTSVPATNRTNQVEFFSSGEIAASDFVASSSGATTAQNATGPGTSTSTAAITVVVPAGALAGTATFVLGPLTLTATGNVLATVSGTATLSLGPFVVSAAGIRIVAALSLGPLILTSLGTPSGSGVTGNPTTVTLADTPLSPLAVADMPLTSVTLQDAP